MEALWPVMLEGVVRGLVLLLSTWSLWAFLLVMVALRLGPRLYEAWRLRRAGMDQVDRMSGLEFEKYLEILFSRLGYNAERTPYVGDQGGDLVLKKGGERILVQAKRHSKAVGNKAVQEAAAARPHYHCDRAMVVANQEFTKSAKELAKSNQVELWGRRKLAEVILSLQAGPAAAPMAAPQPPAAKQEVAIASATPAVTPIAGGRPSPAPTCQRCGKPMVKRESTRGSFWGCSGFPRCRFTMDL